LHLSLYSSRDHRDLHSFPTRRSSDLDAEDLYSAGTIGLLNAVRNFNPKSGTALETYARVRIRGAVFDELRRMDWVPRSVHGKARSEEHTSELQSRGHLVCRLLLEKKN